MKVKFTSLRLQADARGLIVLNLPQAADVHIRSTQVWLTHSGSNNDYILPHGARLSLAAGRVLIEGLSGDAVVDVRAAKTDAFAWLKNLTKNSRAVCVCA